MSERINKREALRRVYVEAYEQAEGGLGHCDVRSLGYAARRLVEQQFGIPADSITLTHNGDHGEAWRSFERLHPERAAEMEIYFGERGEGVEPHTGHRLRFGTQAVREYVEGWDVRPSTSAWTSPSTVSTCTSRPSAPTAASAACW